MNRRHDKYERELRDPALSAALKNTFANDPALAEAPGRTERIMRMVLAAEKKPVRRPSFLAPLAWAAAAAATAVFVVALAIGATRLPSSWNNSPLVADGSSKTTSPQTVAKHHPAPQNKIATVPQDQVFYIPVVRPQEDWVPQERPETPKQSKHPLTPKNSEKTPEQPQNAVRVAAALYDAGSAAHAAGDLQSAYQAYQASYAAMPTANAILASSDVLGRMADEALDGQQG